MNSKEELSIIMNQNRTSEQDKPFVVLTKNEFDNLIEKRTDTLYIIKEENNNAI